jgi:hypothetical protein
MHIAKMKQAEDEADHALPVEAAAAVSDGDSERRR